MRKQVFKHSFWLVLAAVLAAGCTNPFFAPLLGDDGRNGQTGNTGEPPGLPGIIWVGPQADHDAARGANNGSLEEGLAYYNTGDQKAYIYTGGVWKEMTSIPEAAAGIIWVGPRGSHAEAAAAHGGLEEGLAYYNTGDNLTYIYTGDGWNEIVPLVDYYWVRFDSRGGNFVSPQLVAEGHSAHEPSPGPARAGFAFAGWFDTPATGSGSFDFNRPVSGAVTVYAHWETLVETLLDDFPYGAVIHGVWYIHNEGEWIAAVGDINREGDGADAADRKNYLLHIAGSFELAGTTSPTFSPRHITVAIRGSGAELIQLKGTGALLSVGADQRALARKLALQGLDGNTTRLVQADGAGAELWLREGAKVTANGAGGVLADNGAKFTMDGNAAVFGNRVAAVDYSSSIHGGGVLARGGASFKMDGNASVYGNLLRFDNLQLYPLPSGLTSGGGGVAVSGVGSSFIMDGSASVTGNRNTAGFGNTMHVKVKGGGVWIEDGANCTMGGNASVYGNITYAGSPQNPRVTCYGGGVAVSGAGSGFTMSGSASVSGNQGETSWNGGGVYVESGAKFTMGGSASVSRNFGEGPPKGGGVSVGDTDSQFVMRDNTSVSGHSYVGEGDNPVGLGVYVRKDASFEMSGSASVSGNTGRNKKLMGIGVFVAENAEFTMGEHAAVSGNSGDTSENQPSLVEGQGAGIYVENGKLVMRGSASVYGNSFTGEGQHQGGGVFVYNGTLSSTVSFEMHDYASVSGNTLNSQDSAEGGGIFLWNHDAANGGVVFTMDRYASVSGNSAVAQSSARGGGIFANTPHVRVIMAGNASVSGNTLNGSTESFGGGVFFGSNDSGAGPATFDMYENASISGNKLVGIGDCKGGGVYLDQTGTLAAIFSIYSGTVYGSTLPPAAPPYLKNDAGGGIGDGAAIYKKAGMVKMPQYTTTFEFIEKLSGTGVGDDSTYVVTGAGTGPVTYP